MAEKKFLAGMRKKRNEFGETMERNVGFGPKNGFATLRQERIDLEKKGASMLMKTNEFKKNKKR